MTERAGDAAPDPIEELGVGVELVLEVLLGRTLVGISIVDEDDEEVAGRSGEIVPAEEWHVGLPEESRLHSYPPARGKMS